MQRWEDNKNGDLVNKMKSIFLYVLFLLICGCSTSSDSIIVLKDGQALITIDNIEYHANAVMNFKLLADKEFERISLIINDSVQVEILKEHFMQEKIIWSTNNAQTQEVIFSLKYFYSGGTMYYAEDGWLSILQNTPTNLLGKFEIRMHDVSASCLGCPETYKNLRGEFNVSRE